MDTCCWCGRPLDPDNRVAVRDLSFLDERSWHDIDFVGLFNDILNLQVIDRTVIECSYCGMIIPGSGAK